MDLDTAEPTMSQNQSSLRQFPLTKWSFSVHSTTTRIVPYVHSRLDSILELNRAFPIDWNMQKIHVAIITQSKTQISLHIRVV